MAPQGNTSSISVQDKENATDEVPATAGDSGAADTPADYYGLKRLFNPDSVDHLTIEEQLERYKQRDLRKVKIYKIAASIWGEPRVRKRAFFAPPMQRRGSGDGLPDSAADFPHKPLPPICSELRPQVKPSVQPTEEQVAAAEAEEQRRSYRSWMDERMKLRADLEGLGLSEEWLARKPERTAQEQRMLERMVESRRPKAQTPPVDANEMSIVPTEIYRKCLDFTANPDEDWFPPVEEELLGDLSAAPPAVQRPSPAALGAIARRLRQRRLRLLDLFTAADKSKKWTLSRNEFRVALEEAGIALPDVLLDDLVVTLDSELQDEIHYRDLSVGMAAWRRERREEAGSRLGTSRPRLLSPGDWDRLVGFDSPGADTLLSSSFSASTSHAHSSAGPTSSTPAPASSPGGRQGQTYGGLTPDWGPEAPDPGKQLWSSSPGAGSACGPVRPLPPPGGSGRSPRGLSPAGWSKPPTGAGANRAHVGDATLTPHSNSNGSKSASSFNSSGSSQLLEPPPLDLRPEQKILSSEEAMVELRKHNREALPRLRKQHRGLRSSSPKTRLSTNPGCVKTGDAAVDAHMAPSTLSGGVADAVHAFRQQCLREFHDAVALCSKHGVALSDDLLKRVMLHPGDRPVARARRQLRQPGLSLPARRDLTQPQPPQRRATSRSRRQGTHECDERACAGESVAEVYPPRADARPRARWADLSTGRARVRARVDCWMTFEEYEALTRHLAPRSPRLPTRLGCSGDSSAFWPGRLLHKLRLYLEEAPSPGEAVFHRVSPGTRSHALHT